MADVQLSRASEGTRNMLEKACVCRWLSMHACMHAYSIGRVCFLFFVFRFYFYFYAGVRVQLQDLHVLCLRVHFVCSVRCFLPRLESLGKELEMADGFSFFRVQQKMPERVLLLLSQTSRQANGNSKCTSPRSRARNRQ